MDESGRPALLVVADEEGAMQTLVRLLRLEGYQVQTAIDAETGLRAATSSPADAVLVDFRRPLIDGLEFLYRLRAHPDHRDTPVVIATGATCVEDTLIAEIRRLGADVYGKPLWREDLGRLVRGLLTADSYDQRPPWRQSRSIPAGRLH